MDVDGAIYIHKVTRFVNVEENPNPFLIKAPSIVIYQPNTPTMRIANQYGYFSIHNQPILEFDNESFKGELERYIIPKSLKEEMVHMLNHYGINYLNLFPDLEGLSKHLCWFAEHYKFWDGTILDE